MEEMPGVPLLGFGDRRLQEPAHAKELRRHLGTALEVEPLKCAATLENRPARLPERADGFRTRCVAPYNLFDTAGSTHDATVRHHSHEHIGKNAPRAAGNYGFATKRLAAGQRRSSLCNSART